jgi:hypothetical protein
MDRGIPDRFVDEVAGGRHRRMRRLLRGAHERGARRRAQSARKLHRSAGYMYMYMYIYLSVYAYMYYMSYIYIVYYLYIYAYIYIISYIDCILYIHVYKLHRSAGGRT